MQCLEKKKLSSLSEIIGRRQRQRVGWRSKGSMRILGWVGFVSHPPPVPVNPLPTSRLWPSQTYLAPRWRVLAPLPHPLQKAHLANRVFNIRTTNEAPAITWRLKRWYSLIQREHPYLDASEPDPSAQKSSPLPGSCSPSSIPAHIASSFYYFNACNVSYKKEKKTAHY